jgi:hypothetical protein
VSITQAGTSTIRRADFHCRRCDHHQSADVTGIGEGVQSFLNADGTAERRARTDAVKDVQRTIRVARCPSCRQRNPGAVLRFFRPHLIALAVFIAGGFVAGYLPTWLDINMRQHDRDLCKWVCPLLIGGPAVLIYAFTMLAKWSGIDRRVRWIANPDG